jgi:hypothetical protein
MSHLSGRFWVVTFLVVAAMQRLALAQSTPQAPIPGFVACSYPLDAPPIAMAAGDFNHDGNPDLAVINSSNSRVSVLLTNPADFARGACLEAITPSTVDVASPGAVAIAAGDLDRNATIDLVVAVQAGVVIARGSGNGSFSVDTASLAAGTDPQAVAIVDVDQDGRKDIVVGDGNGNSISILYGSDTGFEPFVSLPVNGPVTAMVVEDLNKDSFVDITAVSNFNGQALVFLQNPSLPRSFRSLPPVSVGVAPTAVAAGDFNGDGVPDLAVTSGGADGVLGILLSQLPGNESTPFAAVAAISSGPNPVTVAADDFNRDAFLDAVVANQGDSSVPFFLGDGTGSMTKVPGNCGGQGNACVAGAAPRALVLADVDGDGRNDVIVANEGGSSLTFLLTSQPPPTPSPTLTPTDSPPPTSTPTSTATDTPTQPTSTPTVTVTPTRTSTDTPTMGITPTPTSQCFAAGVCIQGKSCTMAPGEPRSGDVGGWLLPPLLLLWWRRRRSL